MQIYFHETYIHRTARAAVVLDMLRAIIAAVLLSACTSPIAELAGDPVQYALDSYQGELPEACVERALDIEFVEVELSVVRERCNSQRAVGCVEKYDAVSSRALIARGEKADTYAHEAMHIILRCATGDGDATHSRDEWHTKWL